MGTQSLRGHGGEAGRGRHPAFPDAGGWMSCTKVPAVDGTVIQLSPAVTGSRDKTMGRDSLKRNLIETNRELRRD
jgi:hypothetical protein